MGKGIAKRARESAAALADVFRVPALRRLSLAYLASLVSLWSFAVASSVYAFGIGGAALVGVLAVVRLLPAAVVSPFAAALADRYPRRQVLVATDLIRAALTGAAAASIWLDLPPATVFALTGALIMVSTLFEPAKNALLPELVREPGQLAAANAVTGIFASAGTFVGPALGGGLLIVTTIPAAMSVTAALLLASTALLLRLGHEGAREAAPPRSLRQELTAGLLAVATEPTLRLLLGLSSAAALVAGMLNVLVVVMAFELFDLGQGGVGLLNASVGVGATLGGVVALSLAGARRLSLPFATGIVLWGVPIALVGAFTEPAVAVVLLVLVGVGDTLVEISSITLLQRAVPDEVRARVFGVLEGLIWGAIGIGGGLAPLLISLFGERGALVAAGAIMPTLLAVSWTRLARVDEISPAPTSELGLLQGIPILAPLGVPTLEALASEAERVHFGVGEEVTKQGEPGEHFYVIVDGRVEVYEDGVRVREEGTGEFFGEIALLRDVPRTATVRAITELDLLALGREAFVPAVSGHAESAAEAEAVVAGRLGSARRTLATL
jgi:MFS family permease